MRVRCGALLLIAVVVSGCDGLFGEARVGPLLGEAPEECGFPDGATLEYAGRSTTALLGVQEALGDPMAVEPADIYITRDQFDQGENHGRLVCAIYVGQAGFTEVTVHPADDPFVPPTPAPVGSKPAGGIDRQQAVEAALAQIGDADDWEVTDVRAGSIATLTWDWETQEWTAGMEAEDWVWRVSAWRDEDGVEIFLDYVSGAFLGELRYIS